ncbi:MAG TPA: hypothetical protein VGP37_01950 [Candidatus Nanopelagicales bacterium]|nr:hypothetical protein [Candidatus Nanopelagicales bacterium]
MNSNVSLVIDGGLQIVGVIVLVLGIVVFLLWKSMNRQIKKINVDLPPGPADERIAEEKHFTEEAVIHGEEERDEDEQRT